MNETIQNLYSELLIPSEYESIHLNQLATTDYRYLKDLKLNVSTVLKSQHLTKKEAVLLALATAINEKHTVLTKALTNLVLQEECTETEIAEVKSCTSLLNANNVLYRFRHFLPQNEYYNNTPAGLRMSIMMNPVLGKEFFELLSLAVSALNGCELCVTAHENSVKQHGASEARIYDAIRLVSVLKSLCVIL